MNNKQKHGLFVAIVGILCLVQSANPFGELGNSKYTYLWHWFDSTEELLQTAVLFTIAGISWVLLFREKGEPMSNKQKHGIFVAILGLLWLVAVGDPVGEREGGYTLYLHSLLDEREELLQTAGLFAIAGMSWVLLFRENKGNDNG